MCTVRRACYPCLDVVFVHHQTGSGRPVPRDRGISRARPNARQCPWEGLHSVRTGASGHVITLRNHAPTPAARPVLYVVRARTVPPGRAAVFRPSAGCRSPPLPPTGVTHPHAGRVAGVARTVAATAAAPLWLGGAVAAPRCMDPSQPSGISAAARVGVDGMKRSLLAPRPPAQVGVGCAPRPPGWSYTT